MMAYRLTKKKYKDLYDGVGALKVFGRWHHKPVALMYASQATILSAAELLVNSMVLPRSRFIQSFDIPDKHIISYTEIPHKLAKDWNKKPMPPTCHKITYHWLNETKLAGLLVPSTLTPTEMNLLVNPAFFDKKWIKQPPFRFSFDKRLSVPLKAQPDNKENETKKIVKNLRKLHS